jgi:hypothetical protein
MLTQIFTIAKNAFVESIRQPVFFVMLLVAGLAQVLNTWNTGFSMGMDTTGEVSGDNKLLLDVGMATVFVCGMLLAAFVATAVISREVDNKTILTIVSKPVARPTLVLGKYLGVAAAILLAMGIMLGFLIMAIRHGVMSTASDELDGPVLAFSLGSVALAMLVGAWSNYFYGWNFPQTFASLLCPLIILSCIALLFVGKEWKIQDHFPGPDFKPQILFACICLIFAVMVMTAVATAVSTRLGQVMTIVVCVGVFLAAMLSNYVVGRHVFKNTPSAEIFYVTHPDISKTGFNTRGERIEILTLQPPNPPFRVGDPIFISPSPNGYPLNHPEYTRTTINPEDSEAIMAGPSALVVTRADGLKLELRNVGIEPVPVVRAPERGDWIFTQPTEVNHFAYAAWGAIPNLQFFWILDAITQNRPIPPHYLVLAFAYALTQIGAFLSLGVILFQGRDVG